MLYEHSVVFLPTYSRALCRSVVDQPLAVAAAACQAWRRPGPARRLRESVMVKSIST